MRTLDGYVWLPTFDKHEYVDVLIYDPRIMIRRDWDDGYVVAVAGRSAPAAMRVNSAAEAMNTVDGWMILLGLKYADACSPASERLVA